MPLTVVLAGNGVWKSPVLPLRDMFVGRTVLAAEPEWAAAGELGWWGQPGPVRWPSQGGLLEAEETGAQGGAQGVFLPRQQEETAPRAPASRSRVWSLP